MNSDLAMLNLLDKNIDDIDDLPGFEAPVPGMYTLKLWANIKTINNKPSISCNFEVIECVELADAALEPTKPGTKFNTLHQLESEIGMGKFKEIAAPVAKHFGEGNLKALITEYLKESEPVIVLAKLKRRKDKEDAEKFYADVSQVTVAC